jgi:putative ABC transport system permease protein
MSNLIQDVRHSVRLLLKNPGFSLTAILVLALGIGANAAIFTLVNGLLFRPLVGSERPGQPVGIYSHDHTRPNSYRGFSYPAFVDVRDRASDFSHVTAFTLSFVGIGEGDATRRSFAVTISRNYFATLGVDLMAGRTFTEEEERPDSRVPVAIVSYAYWKSHGADVSMLGKTIRLNSRPYTIVGIAPRGFTGSSALVAPEAWVPIGANELVQNDFMRDGNRARTLADRRNEGLMVIGRLKPGLTPDGIAPSLKVLSGQLEREYPAENKNQLLTAARLSRVSISTNPQTNDGLGSTFGLLMAMAAIVLVVSCLNLANMMLARGTARRKEIAMRLALGGGRGRIVRQLLTEGLILSLLGGAFGLLLGFWGVNLLVATLMPLSPVPLTFDGTPDVRIITATFSFCVLSTLVFSLGPAWKLSRTSVVSELKEQGGEDSRARFRAFSEPARGHPDRAVAGAAHNGGPVHSRRDEGRAGRPRLPLRRPGSGRGRHRPRGVRRDTGPPGLPPADGTAARHSRGEVGELLVDRRLRGNVRGQDGAEGRNAPRAGKGRSRGRRLRGVLHRRFRLLRDTRPPDPPRPRLHARRRTGDEGPARRDHRRAARP